MGRRARVQRIRAPLVETAPNRGWTPAANIVLLGRTERFGRKVKMEISAIAVEAAAERRPLYSKLFGELFRAKVKAEEGTGEL